MKKWLITAKWKWYQRKSRYMWHHSKFIEWEYQPYRKPRKHDRDDYGQEEMVYIWLFNKFLITIKPHNPEFNWLTKPPYNR
jgi:hypothetical protein